MAIQEVTTDRVRTDLTAQRVRAILDYDPTTGRFVWKTRDHAEFQSYRLARSWQGRFAGKTAGHLNTVGYVYLHVDGRLQLAHRIAWLYMHGRWPAGCIDHIDGDKGNNRIVNLRDVNASMNAQNLQRAPKKASLLPLGVFFNARKVARAFSSSIRKDGRTTHIGYFDTAEEAHQAYLRAKRLVHPGCTI